MVQIKFRLITSTVQLAFVISVTHSQPQSKNTWKILGEKKSYISAAYYWCNIETPKFNLTENINHPFV